MKNKLYIFAITGTALIFSACKKEIIDPFVDIAGGTARAISRAIRLDTTIFPDKKCAFAAKGILCWYGDIRAK